MRLFCGIWVSKLQRSLNTPLLDCATGLRVVRIRRQCDPEFFLLIWRVNWNSSNPSQRRSTFGIGCTLRIPRHTPSKRMLVSHHKPRSDPQISGSFPQGVGTSLCLRLQLFGIFWVGVEIELGSQRPHLGLLWCSSLNTIVRENRIIPDCWYSITPASPKTAIVMRAPPDSPPRSRQTTKV
jgi:hypothetical protein